MTDAETTNKYPTADAIDSMSTATLRAGAIRLGLSDYETRKTVASFDIPDEVLNHAGALTAIENTLKVLKAAYKDADPRITREYGTAIALKVWTDDSTLRYHLKRKVADLSETDA
jgi:hypothetical protein